MSRGSSLLIMLHCNQNTGYAIGKLEHAFKEAGKAAGFTQDKIHYSYLKVFEPNANIHEISFWNEEHRQTLKNIVIEHSISHIIAFDLQFPHWVVNTAKSAGCARVLSYWGASMSDLFSWPKVAFKKFECWLKKDSLADLYIFESEAMRLTATHGRGIPYKKTHVIPLGVDTGIFRPETEKTYYTHQALNIPQNRKIIFYSGHMEERKGIAVQMRCIVNLLNQGSKDFHFVLCGNQPSQEKPYLELLEGVPQAKDHVTFAGYRNDIPELMRGADIGVITSTGWDSFTMSSIEMLASGLPLIVSDLQGLKETTEHNVTGYIFKTGDSSELATCISQLLNNSNLLSTFSKNARTRSQEIFSISKQITRLSKELN